MEHTSLNPHSALQVYYNGISKEEGGLHPLLLLIIINSFCNYVLLLTNFRVIISRTYAVPLYMVPKIIIFKILPLYIVPLRKS